jgi:hypothetical protein
VDAAFDIAEARELAGMLQWAARAGAGTTRGRNEPLQLMGRYPLAWRDYSARRPSRHLSIPLDPRDNAVRQSILRSALPFWLRVGGVGGRRLGDLQVAPPMHARPSSFAHHRDAKQFL